jgi:hypothetical protein
MFIHFVEIVMLEAAYATTRDRLAAEGLTLTPRQFLRMPLQRRISMATLAREIERRRNGNAETK